MGSEVASSSSSSIEAFSAAMRSMIFVRDSSAGAAVISIGRYDDDFRYLGQRVCKHRNAGGEVTVIVADQNFHNASMNELNSLR